MRAKENLKARPQRKTRTKILKVVLALAAVLIVLVFLLVPALVSSEKGRKIILTKINSSIDGEIDFANLSMSWWRGISVTNCSFNDSSGRTSVEVKQITAKPHYSSIFTGSLTFGKTIIDEPKVEINLKARQAEEPQSSRKEPPAAGESRPIALPIRKIDLVVNNGSLKVTNVQTEAVEFSQINSGLTITFPRGYPAGQMEKLLAGLSAKAKFTFKRVRYLGLNFGPAELDIKIENGLFTIAPFSCTVNNGQLNFAGEADFNRKPILLKTPGPIQIATDIQIDDKITEKLLMYVNPIFASAVNVSGVLNFSCERLALPPPFLSSTEGKGADLTGLEVTGTISIKKLRLQAADLLGTILSLAGTSQSGQDITIHPTRFVLQDGFLRYDDMQMDVGDNPVNFKGVIGLDKSLNMTVTLPYTTTGRTARVGRETAGERISIPLKGTIEKPELDTARLLEGQLKKYLEQELRKGLEELFK